MRNKEVQVIPWVIADSTYVRCPSSRLDSGKTVFVGALHGMLSAEALANIFQDLFKGVVYAGIDTDKYKYPIGSGRVVFNNAHSYMKAVSAAFIEIKTTKFTQKVSDSKKFQPFRNIYYLFVDPSGSVLGRRALQSLQLAPRPILLP